MPFRKLKRQQLIGQSTGMIKTHLKGFATDIFFTKRHDVYRNWKAPR